MDTAISAEEELHWLALRLVPGLGARRAGQLLDQLKTPQAIFRCSRSELEGRGLPGSVAQSVTSGCSFDDAVSQQEAMRRSGTALISRSDPRYPARLQAIYDPPILLFARGRIELLQSLMIGVVGTRRPSTYGINAAERLAADLARAGLTIASGMARGIDTAAHHATLQAEGDTVAVFGCGVDVVYPSENRKLAATMATRGLLLSEFPMGSPGHPQNFPVRNRIISGMSAGILVVEGAQYSGSSITARLAMEQGRDVFAVPGNITSKMSWGPNLLIKQGAKLVQEWTDVVDELTPEDRRILAAKARLRASPEQIALLDQSAPGTSQEKAAAWPPASRAILALLPSDKALHLDTLIETLEDFSPSELLASLFELEVAGEVRQLPGKNFAKVW